MIIEKNGNFTFEHVDYQELPDEELHRICDLWDTLILERDPDEPLPLRESQIKLMKTGYPNYSIFSCVVRLGDKVVGSGGISFASQNSPNYEESKNICEMGVSIHPEYRSQKLGITLLRILAKKAKEKGKITIHSASGIKEGQLFAEIRLGEKPANIWGENRLYLKGPSQSIDWDLMRKWVSEGQERAKDVTLVEFQDCPEDIVEEYTKIYSELLMQQPMGEMEWKFKETPETRRKQEEKRKNEGIHWHSLITVENDGGISGITDISYNPKSAHKIIQHLTGIREEFRGRGMGKWLKAEMLLRIHQRFPEVLYISSGNSDVNDAMLSINRRMGFKRHIEWRNYKSHVDDLLQKIS